MDTYDLQYETWKEQDKPSCPECDRPVLLGYRHFCPVIQEMVVIAEPDQWPL